MEPSLRFDGPKATSFFFGAGRLGAFARSGEGLAKWVCIDFDGGGHAAPLVDPLAAALTTLERCKGLDVPAYLEKSGGGKGWHVWIFFRTPIAAAKARALGLRILPDPLPLTKAGPADPQKGSGIEVFPKAESLRAQGVGTAVW